MYHNKLHKIVLVMQFCNEKEEDVWNKIPAVASRTIYFDVQFVK